MTIILKIENVDQNIKIAVTNTDKLALKFYKSISTKIYNKLNNKY